MKEFIDLTSKIKDNFAEAIKTILEDDEVTVLSQNTDEITKILVSILQNINKDQHLYNISRNTFFRLIWKTLSLGQIYGKKS